MWNFLKLVRRLLTRTFIPKASYYLFGTPTRSLKPLSDRFGYDRGTPIDRYYIEKFLEENRRYITGKCLEIHDTAYIKKYGHGVSAAHALDIDKANSGADIIADLRHMPSVPSDEYDCLILTSTFGMIDNLEAAVSECMRVLKPGGVILATMSALNRVEYLDGNFWAFRTASAKYLFSKYFSSVETWSFGNVLAGQAFWVGESAESLTQTELDFRDAHYPVVISVVAYK